MKFAQVCQQTIALSNKGTKGKQMPNLIRTLLRHERTLAPAEQDRGARHWSAVQLLTPTWFFVESCDSGEQATQRWVTASIREAARIREVLEPSTWARIFVCLRAPMSIREATLFEEIDEAYQVGNSGTCLIHLATGLSYMVGSETIREVWAEPEKLQLLYSRQRCSGPGVSK